MAFLFENLLTLAEQMLDIEHVGTAALRRAISTAYYAVFRRLASLCAAEFALPAPMERSYYDAVLRALNHKEVLKVLKSDAARAILARGIAELFEELLIAREWADYSSASHVDATKAKADVKLTRIDATRFISNAREIIAAIDALDERSQHKLSILLAFHKR